MPEKKKSFDLGDSPFFEDPPVEPLQDQAQQTLPETPKQKIPRSGKTRGMSMSLTARDEVILLKLQALATELNPKLNINKRWNMSAMAKLAIRIMENHMTHVPAIEKVLLELKDEDSRGKQK